MSTNMLFLISYFPTPLILLIAGIVMWRFPPKYGENIGYKTELSRSSRQAWDFAQVYWGRLMTFISVPVLVLSMVAGVVQVVMNVSKEVGFIWFMVVMMAQLVPIFVSIGVTESRLKKEFR